MCCWTWARCETVMCSVGGPHRTGRPHIWGWPQRGTIQAPLPGRWTHSTNWDCHGFCKRMRIRRLCYYYFHYLMHFNVMGKVKYTNTHWNNSSRIDSFFGWYGSSHVNSTTDPFKASEGPNSSGTPRYIWSIKTQNKTKLHKHSKERVISYKTL